MKKKPCPHTITRLFAGALGALAFLLGAPPAQAAVKSAADETITLHVVPERDVVYRGGSREVIVEVEVKAKRPAESYRSPVNLSVVLDRSGSMAGAKIEKARQAACAALDKLEPDDFFSLVIFDNRTELLIPAERVGTVQHRAEWKSRIERIQPGGGTALYAGVQMGAKEVRRNLDAERVNRVILVSDGLANVGPQRTSDLVELGRSLREEKLSVTTIGLGDDFNEDLMTGLAEASHANYYYVKDAEKLPGIFAEELGSAGSRVASSIRIRIEVPAGVCVREIVGHPEIKCEERAAEISLPELFGSEHRIYHLRCHVDEAGADSVALAKVGLTYEDEAMKKRASQTGSASVRLTDDEKKSIESIRDETARNVAVLQNRLDKEAAVALADAGRPKEAAALLEQRVYGNAQAPANRQLPAVAEENRRLQSWADELKAKGNLGNTSRKAAQYENYQDRAQKR
ncbi:MAG TPA: VWA domain-containing protein [Chthoniobacteraceae bacterium]|jgi:Ca-activated chloride channel family protein|nr:VWA domain-containing protein [Chthoniobacteraceae bacterium]